MSASGGMPARRTGLLFLAAIAAVLLAGCEYTGPEEPAAAATSPASNQLETPPPASFEQNVEEVGRKLKAAPTDAGMPSDAEPAGKLVLALAPGDYTITGACAGVYGAKLTVTREDGVPETAYFECKDALDKFFRHDGGPLTITAVPPEGKPAATGVTVQRNQDPRASKLEDFSEWSGEQLQPKAPGELRGASSGNTGTGMTLMADPGQYHLDFLCAGPSFAELSVSTAAGAEVIAPVRVLCDGQAVRMPVLLPTQGADLSMSPLDGVEGRYAYRLVPSTEP
ncbi:hypothetical protein [Pseudarthrobacter chlorophenolicus]|uniref:hypothetical protein n=1 Tax=Pseudarthrobacter chlorophenolicus TaxID=85085 RepID=UPI001269C49C|nr:hypothetical protein [Pseudarthrobacter chlorophenolicus]